MGLIQEIVGKPVETTNKRPSKLMKEFLIFNMVFGSIGAILITSFADDDLVTQLMVFAVLITYTLISSWIIWIVYHFFKDHEVQTDYLKQIAEHLKNK